MNLWLMGRIFDLSVTIILFAICTIINQSFERNSNYWFIRVVFDERFIDSYLDFKADEMDEANQELRITIKKIWPLQAKKVLDLIIPQDQGIWLYCNCMQKRSGGSTHTADTNLVILKRKKNHQLKRKEKKNAIANWNIPNWNKSYHLESKWFDCWFTGGYQHFVKSYDDCYNDGHLKTNRLWRERHCARTQRREAHCRQSLRWIIDPRELESDSFRAGRSHHANGTSLCLFRRCFYLVSMCVAYLIL